jgi:hypothetical protein
MAEAKKNKMTEENSNGNCIFPKCPRCNAGYLLPFSFKTDVFEKWKCSNPDCGHELRKRE